MPENLPSREASTGTTDKLATGRQEATANNNSSNKRFAAASHEPEKDTRHR